MDVTLEAEGLVLVADANLDELLHDLRSVYRGSNLAVLPVDDVPVVAARDLYLPVTEAIYW